MSDEDTVVAVYPLLDGTHEHDEEGRGVYKHEHSITVNEWPAHNHGAKKPVRKNGHEFTPENIYINPRGQRECKACRRASFLKWKGGGA